MPQRKRNREIRWPHTVAIRVESETWQRLNRLADAEGRMLGAVGRDVLARGLTAAEKASAGRRGRPS